MRANETLDAISGWYRILQLKAGHRFSTDDILTAWYGTAWCPRADHVLDLGSGIGSVAMTAAGAKVTNGVPAQPGLTRASSEADNRRLRSALEIKHLAG